jgi:glycosyltransferase involved in cell wall biosynthesis
MLFMRAKGWQVHAMASPGEYESTLKSNSISFHPVLMHPRINPFSDLVSIARMWNSIRRLRPAIVHAHTLKAGLLGMISATLARVPVRAFHVHGLPHLGACGFKYRLLVWSTRVACMLAHRVYCVSFSVRQVLIDENLCPADKAVVPMNGSCDGIDARNRFNPDGMSVQAGKGIRTTYGVPPDVFLMAFIGRLVRHKGLIELCSAWPLLSAAHPDLHFLIVGDIEPQDPIPADTLKIFRADPRVHMTGLCGDMPALYAAVDLVVLPSYYEGFPTVLLEAAAMRLPVVATAIPGNVDAVRDNETGLLFDLHDVPGLVRAVERYWNDPLLRRNHADRARERILRHFHPEPIREFIYGDYDRLLNCRGMQSPVPLTGDPSPNELMSAEVF